MYLAPLQPRGPRATVRSYHVMPPSLPTFRLQFSPTQIQSLASRYAYVGEGAVGHVLQAVPLVRKRGHLRKEELVGLARWKAPRSVHHARKNTAEFVAEVTGFCLAARTEEARILPLTTLHGVAWPMASCLLHFFHPDPYPILDFRALQSLGVAVPGAYSFAFWSAYVAYCRKLAQRHKVDMRTLDRALWQFSKEQAG